MRPLMIFIVAAAVTLFAQNQKPSPSDAALDRMIAAGKSPQELAEYVFNTHGCQSCHTMGHDGKLGFTDRGKERARALKDASPC